MDNVNKENVPEGRGKDGDVISRADHELDGGKVAEGYSTMRGEEGGETGARDGKEGDSPSTEGKSG